MRDRLFEEARRFVEQAQLIASENSDPHDQAKALDIAKNAVSSAFANSTFAQQRQLQEFQHTLDRLS
ncbi:DUF3813 domain-containing protein [Lederbergia lenta]|uniref:Uncharacterized protein yizC n=1 Tax=Lederbergia lenta TaxID=1467 RepID=A0A2X4WTD2_LEDLE|nr:DUF3813 domain-containing protein [Lederbergia lenta]MCM3110467.1 DUF3813 domain-containing protein [Lederbergia lenta]MEC2323967.1 DUF3813 domain-containing protein [Lederbergia lenta]SQI60890.1 Uncharacterized protein yizC [Lederbergia lenta]